jgi:polyphosphate glucokinase
MPVTKKRANDTNILSIDIGGTSIKACILSSKGDLISEFTKVPTPEKSTPDAVLKCIKELVAKLEGQPFERISIGFPGYVKCGKVQTAVNLAKNKWTNVDLAQQVSDLLGKPVRLINDADQQALGIVALVYDGDLLPHLELAHLPITKNKDYDDYIGTKAFEKIGIEKWNERLQRIIEIYKTVFNYDTLYIGGGNSKHINFQLDHNIHLATNKDGIKGGAKLWELEEKYCVFTNNPSKK